LGAKIIRIDSFYLGRGGGGREVDIWKMKGRGSCPGVKNKILESSCCWEREVGTLIWCLSGDERQRKNGEVWEGKTKTNTSFNNAASHCWASDRRLLRDSEKRYKWRQRKRLWLFSQRREGLLHLTTLPREEGTATSRKVLYRLKRVIVLQGPGTRCTPHTGSLRNDQEESKKLKSQRST